MKKKHGQHAETAGRKMQIINAALDCFAETGYVDATMEAIRVRSGASNGSIYHHFKSKEQLAAAVYIEGIRDYQSGLMEVLPELPAREGVCAIVRYHLEWVAGNRVWAQYLFSMRHADFMGESEGAISEQNAEFVETLAGWIRKRVAEGKLRKMPRLLYMSLIWGPCQEYARLWLEGKGGADELEEAAVEIGEAAWRALGEEVAASDTGGAAGAPELI